MSPKDKILSKLKVESYPIWTTQRSHSSTQQRIEGTWNVLEEAKAEVDSRDEFGRTPFLVFYDHPEVGAKPLIKAIREGDLAVNHIEQYTGLSILDYAASSGNVEVLKIILDHPSLKSIEEWLTLSLIERAAMGGIESLTLLLQRVINLQGTAVATLPSLTSRKIGIRDLYTVSIYNAMTTNRPEKFEFLNSLGLQEHETMSLDKLPRGQKSTFNVFSKKRQKTARLTALSFRSKSALRNKTEILQYPLNNHEVHIHFSNGRYATGPTALWGAINLKSFDSIAMLLRHGGLVDRIDKELRDIKGPTIAILREEHTREYVEWARHVWQNLNPPYVRLEFDSKDNEWLRVLQIRKGNGELRETGIGAKELSEPEGVNIEGLGKDDVRRVMPPMPTLLDREAELRSNEDLIPEFKPYTLALGFPNRLVGNPEVY
ncbi:hypothetical protein RRF57_004721 [Xylaria bambusicola]|uniref:Ankyrin n=1 Tax=Xylaria bambusicola TaxID=326684 RepID=A0AAN7UPA7_9PEZI